MLEPSIDKRIDLKEVLKSEWLTKGPFSSTQQIIEEMNRDALLDGEI